MRLIDADDFIEKMHELYEQAKWGKREIHFSLADLECNVDMMPTIDAVPVIRCEECKWWRKETDHTCRKWGGASPRNANGYCDGAERKEA